MGLGRKEGAKFLAKSNAVGRVGWLGLIVMAPYNLASNQIGKLNHRENLFGMKF